LSYLSHLLFLLNQEGGSTTANRRLHDRQSAGSAVAPREVGADVFRAAETASRIYAKQI
jgi:hypothetical protein